MSAEKCGPAQYQTFSDLDSVKAELKRLEKAEYDGKAGVLLTKIRKKYPNFIPVSEDEIFYRARGLGLVDEE